MSNALQTTCPRCGGPLPPAPPGIDQSCRFCGWWSHTPGPEVVEKVSEEPADEKMHDILRRHSLWLRGDPGGARADFSGAALVQANLSRADLTRADLSGADLTQADLRGARLEGAQLVGADLTQARMSGAILTGANLSRANLTQTQDVDLSGTKFWGATLTQASYVLRGSWLMRLLAWSRS